MILIDATYINNGGGKVLLDYLIEELEKTDYNVFYLIDDRIKIPYKIKENNFALYQNASLRLRDKFYKLNRAKFKKVLVLGNIPPPVRLSNILVYTYFHNPMLLNVPNSFSLLEKIKYFLKVNILKYYSKNTDYWLLQSEILKAQFINNFKQSKKVIILPFYPSLAKTNIEVERIKNTFFYVSNAQANKNHIKLLNAFCKAYDVRKQGKLIVTVSEKFPEVLKLINELKMKNYPIENIGFVNRDTLKLKYLESEFVIFPSLAESFGLGIIEGIELGCKILGADLEYTYAVCEPSLVFDPSNEEKISEAFIYSMGNDLSASKLKVNDNINKLIKLLG